NAPRAGSLPLPAAGGLADLGELDRAQAVLLQSVRLQAVGVMQDLLPAAELVDVLPARDPLAALGVHEVVDADQSRLAGVPVGDVDTGIEADAVEVDPGVQSL